MRVKWVEIINIPEIYWNTDIDIKQSIVHKEGEVIETVNEWWTTYFVVKLDNGEFTKIPIDEATAI